MDYIYYSIFTTKKGEIPKKIFNELMAIAENDLQMIMGPQGPQKVKAAMNYIDARPKLWASERYSIQEGVPWADASDVGGASFDNKSVAKYNQDVRKIMALPYLTVQRHVLGVLVDKDFRSNSAGKLIMGPNIPNGQVYRVSWFEEDLPIRGEPKKIYGSPIIMPQQVDRMNPASGEYERVWEDHPKDLRKELGGKPFIQIPIRNVNNPQEIVLDVD